MGYDRSEKAIFLLCVVAVLYIVAQVIRAVIR